jgi:hypothetical protein
MKNGGWKCFLFKDLPTKDRRTDSRRGPRREEEWIYTVDKAVRNNVGSAKRRINEDLTRI